MSTIPTSTILLENLSQNAAMDMANRLEEVASILRKGHFSYVRGDIHLDYGRGANFEQVLGINSDLKVILSK